MTTSRTKRIRGKNWLDKLEKKYGKYTVKDLSRYIVVVFTIGFLLEMFNPSIYRYLACDFSSIFRGEIWRVVTFVFKSPYAYSGGVMDVLWFGLLAYITLIMGRSIENVWGSFKFNLYIFSYVLMTIVGNLLSQLIFGVSGTGFEAEYIYKTLFLTFAVLYPNMEFLLFFMLPIKVKWLALVDGFLIVSNIASNIILGLSDSRVAFIYFAMAFMEIVCILNFILFFYSTTKNKKKAVNRKKSFEKQLGGKYQKEKTRHKCSICKKTEEDDPNLTFRYCSKCDGNHEYCSEHLFTHEHIKKFSIKIDKEN